MASKTAMFMHIHHKRFSLSNRGRCFTIMCFIIVYCSNYVDPNAKLFSSCYSFCTTVVSIDLPRHFPFPWFFMRKRLGAAIVNNSSMPVFPWKQPVNRMSGGFVAKKGRKECRSLLKNFFSFYHLFAAVIPHKEFWAKFTRKMKFRWEQVKNWNTSGANRYKPFTFFLELYFHVHIYFGPKTNECSTFIVWAIVFAKKTFNVFVIF